MNTDNLPTINDAASILDMEQPSNGNRPTSLRCVLTESASSLRVLAEVCTAIAIGDTDEVWIECAMQFIRNSKNGPSVIGPLVPNWVGGEIRKLLNSESAK